MNWEVQDGKKEAVMAVKVKTVSALDPSNIIRKTFVRMWKE